MAPRFILVFLFFFCLFTGFQEKKPTVEALHALIKSRIKQADTTDFLLLEKTITEVTPQFSTETDVLALLYHRMGAAYFNNDFELKAIPVYEKALEIRKKVLPPTHFDISKTLQGLGRALARVRRAEEGLPLLEENLRIRQATFAPQSDTVAEAMMMLGSIHEDLGNFDKAYSFLGNAIAIFEKNKTDSVRWAYAHQYLGVAHLNGKNYDQALKHFDKSTDLMKLQNDVAGISQCQFNAGVAMMRKKNYALALSYFQKAQKAKPHSEYLNYIANVYLIQNQYDKAKSYINRALDFAQKNPNLCYYYTPRIYVTLGDFYQKQKQNPQNNQAAIAAYDTAIDLFLNKNLTQNIPQTASDPLSISSQFLNLSSQSSSCRPDLLSVLRKRGTALTQSFEQTKNTQFLDLALDNYQKSDSLLREMLQSFSEENSRFFWTENVKDIYENGIRTALALKNNEAALSFAENSRAFNLLTELQNNRAKHFGGVPDIVLAEERQLKSNVAFWQKVASDAAVDSSRIAQARAGLLTAKEAFSQFEKNLEKKYPNYFALKYQTHKPIIINDLQKKLADKMSLVQFFMSDSSVYIFGITKRDVVFLEKKITPDFFNQISNLRRATGDYNFIKSRSDSAQMLYLSSAQSLFKTLLADPLSILGTTERLRIIPDGALSYVPFELLLTDSASNWRDTKTPFLLKKMAVSYAYSNRLLTVENDPQNGDAFGGYGISYAPETFIFNENEKKNEKITALTHTIGEVKTIKNLLGGTTWLDKNATKQAFLDHAPKQNVIHLAMHGFLNPTDPLSSGLIFSRNQASDSSNYLTGYDLYALELKAQLAVLSACNTGDGVLKGREGVISLARSFAYAGCRSLVMSLWSVPDQTTSEIMVKFYENLKSGMPKDVALREAKLAHLASAEPSRLVPNVWAAMILTGDIEPLPLSIGGFSRWIWGILAAFVLFFSFRFFQKKHKIKS